MVYFIPILISLERERHMQPHERRQTYKQRQYQCTNTNNKVRGKASFWFLGR